MNPALFIVLCAFAFVALTIAASMSAEQDRAAAGTESARTASDWLNAPDASVESLDAVTDPGSRVGDHIIDSQSDLADFSSFPDSSDDGWMHED